jgi:hypothetical protein
MEWSRRFPIAFVDDGVDGIAQTATLLAQRRVGNPPIASLRKKT